MRMRPEYAQGFLSVGYAGHWRTLSCHDNLLIVEDLEDYQSSGYLGTRLKDGQFQLDHEGYVLFKRARGVIDENTRFVF